MQCEYYALEGLSDLMETLKNVQEMINPDLEIEGILRTMHDSRSRLAAEVSGQLIEYFGDLVLETIVPRNVRLAEAPSHGLSIMKYDRSSKGGLAYSALADEIVRRNQN
jgi:chromosome partitioning protein